MVSLFRICGLFNWLLLLFCMPLDAGNLIAGDPSNYYHLVRQLKAGDTLVLKAGVYRNGLRIHGLEGRKDQPITITGPENGKRPVFVARRGSNTVSILNSAYVRIRNLELDGRGLRVDGVKAEGHAAWTHHITLENLVINGYGHDQQTVAISTKCPSWGWVIRGNRIRGAGTGIYLGNSNGTDPFFAGLIEDNRIEDTIGYNLQIKHQIPRPYISGMPMGTSTTVIRRNVFSKQNGRSGGRMPRPNVLVGHWPLTGSGFRDFYQIYGNVFVENPEEALFQGEGNIALYSNLFVNGSGDAIRIQPHNDVPRAIAIFHNTIVSAGTGISIINREGEDAVFPQRVYANAVFAEVPIAGGEQKGNFVENMEAAAAYLKNPLGSPEQIDLRPIPGRLADNSSYRMPRTGLLEADRDFAGKERTAFTPGAYED